MKNQLVWDVEANGLLDDYIDYTASPYVLKPEYLVHCIVVIDRKEDVVHAFYNGDTIVLDGRAYKKTIDGVEYSLRDYTAVSYEHHQLNDFPEWIKVNSEGKEIVAHNQINFDLLCAKLYFGMDFEVGDGDNYTDSWVGNDVCFNDTLVKSKTLNPDRFGGHSLDSLSAQTGVRKIDFRPQLKGEEKFKVFAPDMLYYCIYDCKANAEVADMLDKEASGWDWESSITLEKKVADIITRQAHRGFKFNLEQAEKNITELDALMEERRQRVEPLLPPKVATKGVQKEYTPPKNQFLKSGQPAKRFVEWVTEKHKGEFKGDKHVVLYGKEYELPLPIEPLITEVPATIDDSTHIKGWLVELGWVPTEWKVRDLTVDSKRVKLDDARFEAAAQRYLQQTLESPFKSLRCDHLEVGENQLEWALSKPKRGALWVRTNPSFTVGQEKELCPDLERISVEFPYVKDVVEYLTFKHRRNSILGGGAEWDEDEEPEKGHVSQVRADGRISTPADTCGAATSRMKHKGVANVPRTTSLYGEPMRAQFEVDAKTHFQLGYDFDSLEAKIESHYCWRYDEGERQYCNSLLQEKPLDVHTLMAARISEEIGRAFERTPAKSVKYGITYGAQAAKVASIIGESEAMGKIVFDAFWEAAKPLALLKDRLQEYWEKKTKKKFVLGIDGRKVPTRAAHAILNSLFQSGGVICAKRAMVIHEWKMKQEGLYVDFFKDDWKNSVFCQQLIAYHK